MFKAEAKRTPFLPDFRFPPVFMNTSGKRKH